MNAAIRKIESIRFSDEEKEIVSSFAEKHGMNFSEYVRRAAMGDIPIQNDRIEKMFEEIRGELKKLTKK